MVYLVLYLNHLHENKVNCWFYRDGHSSVAVRNIVTACFCALSGWACLWLTITFALLFIIFVKLWKASSSSSARDVSFAKPFFCIPGGVCAVEQLTLLQIVDVISRCVHVHEQTNQYMYAKHRSGKFARLMCRFAVNTKYSIGSCIYSCCFF